jgi:hypothetical protein
MANVAWIMDRTSGDITIYVEAKPYSISTDHCNYDAVLDRVKTKQYDDLESLLDIPAAIANASNGKVLVQNSSVYYNGKEIHNILVDRIMEFMNEGIPFEKFALFLENLLQNPSEETIEELYLFLESGHMPVTEDGCFLAYKKVDDNLNSYHRCPDGSHLNHKIGTVVSMPRGQVDTDRNRTCSYGLHFCALGYLKSYAGGAGRVVIVKINPRDVCAIPSDYNNTKGRASCYEVVAEYDSPDREHEEAFDSTYVDTTGDIESAMAHNQSNDDAFVDGSGNWGVKPNGQRYNNTRDSNGRFRKRS